MSILDLLRGFELSKFKNVYTIVPAPERGWKVGDAVVEMQPRCAWCIEENKNNLALYAIVLDPQDPLDVYGDHPPLRYPLCGNHLKLFLEQYVESSIVDALKKEYSPLHKILMNGNVGIDWKRITRDLEAFLYAFKTPR